MSTQDLINKLWSLCHLLRDDGVTYNEYLNELTFLVFLKMVEETGQEKLIPEGYRWKDIEKFNAATRLEEYKKLLVHLGSHGSLITKAIFNNASTCIRKPATLTKLVTEIDKLDWYSAKQEGLGDMYEGLLEINASEKKSGAGQYFTPRVLIEVMVELMKPTPKDKRHNQKGDVIVDPTAGTGGFLIAAHQYMEKNFDVTGLDEADYDSYQHDTFFGMELVPDTRRLAMMNLMLHDLAVDDENSGVLYGDTLSNEGKALPKASLILANPPFGTKQGGGIPTRDDLVHYTSNKQLAFLHAMYHVMLKPGGRAAVVLPDNVLFEGSIGRKIRNDLMEKCNLHTILRLPTGIFYAAGVKTNVLFFDKPTDINQDKGNTKKVWVYDLRVNMPKFGKRTVLEKEHFEEFYRAVGSDLTQVDEVQRQAFIDNHQNGSAVGNIDTCRLRAFTRDEIKAKDDSLDLAWIRDDSLEDAASLPEPDDLIAEAIEELAGAITDLQAILVDLGSQEAQSEVLL
ncbi:N-6 DNA methylase [Vibrio cholerae]|uniref:class I SAM-dependent DNA methyltransferase n=1 Tax=Vibrio TaxID=662 RepID=UPI000DE22F5E|nr:MULTISPECIES: N-6 DNA methylase [Vibrio]EKF9261416.1 N-6 DNA methylase [Vibrio cholerae]EKF9384340.1 N-6 DNA methylase [Vibrio cholerae]EKF9917166.1 N-6 DNA methylase [Vibrio cholerae]EKF9924635.1 N-6 DNA methylase [Vibrio cholerae]EKG0030277.1 N-6 DNA methylase [Vibrio cholerae]